MKVLRALLVVSSLLGCTGVGKSASGRASSDAGATPQPSSAEPAKSIPPAGSAEWLEGLVLAIAAGQSPASIARSLGAGLRPTESSQSWAAPTNVDGVELLLDASKPTQPTGGALVVLDSSKLTLGALLTVFGKYDDLVRARSLPPHS